MNYTDNLKIIMKASGWSQEQLATRLGVTFATLNSWINGKSQPRAKALKNIDNLYLNIVGNNIIDINHLKSVKLAASKLEIDSKQLASNKILLDKLTLFLTYHTNTIEGSTMTLSDVEDVIFDNKVLSNRTAVEQTEARNHQATLHWLIDQLARKGDSLIINEELILGVHLRLMNGIISDAGLYRNHTVRIMGSSVILANWAKVPTFVANLVKEMNLQGDDIVANIAKTHAIFEQIHPFSDGNGRTGRLLILAIALRAGLVPPIVVKERKFAYYKYLELAQTKKTYEPLELFVAESMQFSNTLLNS